MKQTFLKIMFAIYAFSYIGYAMDKPKTVIIFDASGSMWGQIEGKTKIEIAKDALKKVINEWKPEVEVGLTAYGHRSKGDCNDIQTLIPAGKIDKKNVISKVMDIQPKGKTPISRAIRKVADEIRFTEEKATIILISDGKETCDPDPCATAKELEKSGIDFVTHVIGFNVDTQTDKQLKCIADSTGGEYFSAKNATALGDAMNNIVKQLEDNIEITAVEKKGGKWVKARHRIYPIIDGEVGKEYLKWCVSNEEKACTVNLPLGEYLIRTKYDKSEKDTQIVIKDEETYKIDVTVGSTGTVELTAVEESGGKWVKAKHNIYPVVDGEAEKSYLKWCVSKKKKSCIEKLPIGEYVIKSKYNKVKKDTRVKIQSGELNKIEVIMGSTGTVELTAVEESGGKWVKAKHDIHPVIDGEVEKSYLKWCVSKKKKACTEKLPVGEYVIKSKYQGIKKETSLIIKKDEINQVKILMNRDKEIEANSTETVEKLKVEQDSDSSISISKIHNAELQKDIHVQSSKKAREEIKKEYHSNGKIQKETYYQNGEIMMTKYYRQDGTLDGQEVFSNGKKVSRTEFVTDGITPRQKWEYVDGNELHYVYKKYMGGDLVIEGTSINHKRHGIEKNYADGKIRLEISYQNGKKEGLEKKYNQNGKISGETSFVNDKREGDAKIYYDNGDTFKEIVYKNDRAVSGVEYKLDGTKTDIPEQLLVYL